MMLGRFCLQVCGLNVHKGNDPAVHEILPLGEVLSYVYDNAKAKALHVLVHSGVLDVDLLCKYMSLDLCFVHPSYVAHIWILTRT